MKKFPFIFLVFASAIVLYSFTANIGNKALPVANSAAGTVNGHSVKTGENWTVSSYGFLEFPTGKDLDEFMILMQTKTHEEAQDYLSGYLGFSSFGTSLYSPSSSLVLEAEAADYALNTSKVFQVQGVLIKPIGDRDCNVKYEYVLTMTTANLTSSSYSDLQGGTFDSHTMNKFAIDPVTELDPIVVFMGQTDAGYEDTEPFSCASPARRPFWGYGSSGSETCIQIGTWFNPQTNTYLPLYERCLPYYAFWINIFDDCYQAYGCSGPHFNN